MRKSFLSLAFFVSSSLYLWSQTDIKINIANYPSDTLILGYYLADRTLVKDTLLADSIGKFSYQQDSSMEAGMYLLVSQPQGSFYQILVPEDDQEFVANFDHLNPASVMFEGSEENTLFFDYLSFVTRSREDKERLQITLADTDSALVSIRDQLQKDLDAVDQVVELAQRAMIEKYPNSISALLVKSNLPFIFPEFEGTPDEVEVKQYEYYKKRYFDNVDLKHSAILRTPIIDQRINYYLNNLTHNEPDSIISSVDHILSSMDTESETFRYYLSRFLNDYGNSKFIGMDAIYVHLALNYYGKGLAPWVPENNLAEIVANARQLQPILIGQRAPDFTVYTQEGEAVNLSELDNEYTVLVFWRPGCAHCEKAMPDVLSFYENYKDKGVGVLAICTSTGDKYASCWEEVEKKGMNVLMNVGDEFNRSRIFSNYFVKSTPKTFILDRDKVIKIKKVPAENLGAVLDSLMKLADEEKS